MKIAFVTIGEAPRDDVAPVFEARLPHGTVILQDGVLNHLDDEGRRRLDRDDGTLHMVTRDRDGRAYRLSYEETLPHMQQVVDGVVDRGADLVVILCGADWTPVKARVPIVNPGRLFPNLIQALAANLKLGVIKPDVGQIPFTERQFSELGIEAVVTAASPYANNRVELARAAAERLRDHDVGMVWMTCMGMGHDMRDAVSEILPRPIVLAQSVLSRIIAELTEEKSQTNAARLGVQA